MELEQLHIRKKELEQHIRTMELELRNRKMELEQHIRMLELERHIRKLELVRNRSLELELDSRLALEHSNQPCEPSTWPKDQRVHRKQELVHSNRPCELEAWPTNQRVHRSLELVLGSNLVLELGSKLLQERHNLVRLATWREDQVGLRKKPLQTNQTRQPLPMPKKPIEL
jgi:hypothetical protein